ncbi:MAG: hypothetical protein J6W14_01525 [Clostridia bacterium]|nr:hypothetical protein [Clostridia bacterium]
MAETTLVPSTIALTADVIADFATENPHRDVLIYAYRRYAVKSVTAEYAEIELTDPVAWEGDLLEEFEEDEGIYFQYYWLLHPPAGAYLVIGDYHYGRATPFVPERLTARVYRDPANGEVGMQGNGYVYQTEAAQEISFICTGYIHNEAQSDSGIGFSSGNIAYALCLAGGGGISVSVGGAVRNATVAVCANGVIRAATVAVSVGGIIKT